jgi:hypothetical protein
MIDKLTIIAVILSVSLMVYSHRMKKDGKINEIVYYITTILPMITILIFVFGNMESPDYIKVKKFEESVMDEFLGL